MPLLKCPDCQSQVSDVAPTCPGCGRPMQPKRAAAAGGQTSSGCLGLLVLGIVLFGVYVYFSFTNYRPKHSEPPTPTVTTPPAPSLGAAGVLRGLGGSKEALLFEDPNDFDAYAKALAGRDRIGFEEVVRRAAIVVSTGTKAQKIDSKFLGPVRVRVLDGPSAGVAGWVAKECLQAQ